MPRRVGLSNDLQDRRGTGSERVLPRTQHEVIAVLAERGRSHAYELKSLLRGRVGHSSVYAALSALQAKGYVRAEWAIPGDQSESSGPPRKYFELTADGREALDLSERVRARMAQDGKVSSTGNPLP